jgi:hypothetical protein
LAVKELLRKKESICEGEGGKKEGAEGDTEGRKKKETHTLATHTLSPSLALFDLLPSSPLPKEKQKRLCGQCLCRLFFSFLSLAVRIKNTFGACFYTSCI